MRNVRGPVVIVQPEAIKMTSFRAIAHLAMENSNY